MPLTVIPAIDLKDGRCVRLRQGRAEEVTVYGDDPVAMAQHWARDGAEYLHVVDLDGAFEGRPVHLEILARIVEAIPIPVEWGGGLRVDQDVERAIAAGARRVILGTRACAEPTEVERLASRFGNQLVVGIDARDGLVQVRGWTETTPVHTVDLARRMSECGVATLIITDTARDGMLEGVNTRAMADVCDAVPCDVIASGGVTTAADVAELFALRRDNLSGVIVGKALYEGAVSIPSLQQAACGKIPV